MHSHISELRVGSHHTGVPKTCGKACVYHAGYYGDIRGQFADLMHSLLAHRNCLWIKSGFMNVLYTYFVQLSTTIVANFTPVKYSLCTVYTGLTTTTTTYINNKEHIT